VIDLAVVRSLKATLLGGQIDIIGHDEPGARVEVHSVTHRELKIAIEGDHLEIDHPQLRWDNVVDLMGSFGQRKASVSVSVLVPRATAVTLGTVTADALVTGVSGSARFSTVSGEIQTDGLEGDLVLHSISGELSAQNHDGSVSADSVSGDITLSGRLHRVKADTVSGDVFADVDGRCDRIRVNTVSGALTARIDRSLGAVYTVNTVSGTLQLDGQVVKGTRGRGYHQTVAGEEDFSTEILANTLSGNISVIRRDGRGQSATDDAFAGTASPSAGSPGGAPTNDEATDSARHDGFEGDDVR
jgi:DUF4097 and DUF4098 domain-containing protein YvlB